MLEDDVALVDVDIDVAVFRSQVFFPFPLAFSM